MLLTVRHEARRMRFIMPAPERMWKVCASVGRRWWVTVDDSGCRTNMKSM